MSFEITEPTEGKFSIELDWAEAEVFTRAVGMVNSGDLQEYAPTLYDAVQALVTVFGRNNLTEAENFLAKCGMGQVHIEDMR